MEMLKMPCFPETMWSQSRISSNNNNNNNNKQEQEQEQEQQQEQQQQQQQQLFNELIHQTIHCIEFDWFWVISRNVEMSVDGAEFV